MNTVQKDLRKDIRETVTKTDLHNYMGAVEKNILKHIKSESEDIKDEIKRAMKKEAKQHITLVKRLSPLKPSSKSPSVSPMIECGKGKRCPNGKTCKRKRCVNK